MIETLSTTSEAMKLMSQLSTLLEQEPKYQPKLCGLRIIESAHDNGLRMTARLRDFEVKDLLSLTQFFGFCAETFCLTVNILDRFLAKMKVQPKHLACVGLSCFYLAVKAIEEERIVPLASDLIRISQCRFTVSDMTRMEKIILEKLCWKVKAVIALNFLRIYHTLILENSTSERKKMLNFERLEAQLKACHCRIVFSKAKASVLSLSILALEIQEQKLHELTEIVECLWQHSSATDRDLFYWKELVAKCLAEYSTTKCFRPTSQKLKWIISGRTARQLKHSYYRIAHLPTIPEANA
ncbi:cyclin-G1 [Latimeria chalumnae]|uniref:Cyclin G1 n=1 Tax=Latimeria chalumnae TaxID=7897 RepID=H3ARS7_LATCH|nr:PREDICTED: cyclin-G1 [Latimeria chalumnae]XP_005996914.1 PREDICTED: cyclin-G1 [Latimeria chalumnae]|eukprot:XP_005996913.1 PREDICTED: cyclin-G1 [Latimeria chalumnae]